MASGSPKTSNGDNSEERFGPRRRQAESSTSAGPHDGARQQMKEAGEANGETAQNRGSLGHARSGQGPELVRRAVM